MNRIQLLGYDLLGEAGGEGIRYAWKCGDYAYLLESAAFRDKTKNFENGISGYTTSVSLGCILKSMGMACKFCRTGKLLPFSTILSAREIAKQNIMMVLLDTYSHDDKRERNIREFAYMGQGEPGYSYVQLRQAIQITNTVLKQLDQTIYRHIISTAGVDEMIHAFIHDLETGYFTSRVTLHYSLHGTRFRSQVMPLDSLYPYERSFDSLEMVSRLIGEKVCLGVLLLNGFLSDSMKEPYTITLEDLKPVLERLDNRYFRFSLCEYNYSKDVGTAEIYQENEAQKIIEYIRKRGFEVKFFSSFGKKENTACGMLGGQSPKFLADKTWRDLERYAEGLIEEAMGSIVPFHIQY